MRRGQRINSCLVAAVSIFLVTTAIGDAQQARRKGRALLVGIDTYKNLGKEQGTPGSEEDARDTRRLLMEKYGFLNSEIRLLLGKEATAQNIRDTFQNWLIEGTRPGDRAFFFYSGHGTTVNDVDGDEARRTPGDTRDEALAPYDVGDSPTSVIIDDDLEVMINQLSGRMAVLVFDSCHSGTISRGSSDADSKHEEVIAKYLPSPEEINGLATRSGSKANRDDFVVLPPQNAKGLNLVVDRDSIRGGGIVVLSAAQPDQLAFLFRVGSGSPRGVFTYSLNQCLANPGITLKDLKSSVTNKVKAIIKDLHSRGVLKPDKNQEPYFEVFSTLRLDDQPLFGAALTAPAIAMSNPVSTINLGIRTLDGRTRYHFGTDNGRDYHETVSYEVEAGKAGYLYLIVFSEGGVATRIFPNERQQNNWVEAGKNKIFRDALAKEGFFVQEPEGKDVVIALLCSSKLEFGQADGYQREQYPWKEVFDLLNSRRFSEYVGTLTRGQSAKGNSASPSLDMTNWQSASIVVEAKRADK